MGADLLRSAVTDGVLSVTIDRPEKRNALSQDMLGRLGRIFVDHAADESLGVAILRGTGDKNFAAGGDLVETGYPLRSRIPYIWFPRLR